MTDSRVSSVSQEALIQRDGADTAARTSSVGQEALLQRDASDTSGRLSSASSETLIQRIASDVSAFVSSVSMEVMIGVRTGAEVWVWDGAWATAPVWHRNSGGWVRATEADGRASGVWA